MTRKKPVKVFYDYEVDEDADGTVTGAIKLQAANRNALIYEKNSLDVDVEEAKELARQSNKTNVIIVENDSLTPQKVHTKEEIQALQLEFQKKLFDCKTVKELVTVYLLRYYIPRIEMLRLLNVPSVILIREKKSLARVKAGTMIRMGEWENELVKDFIERTGYKGRTYLEITLTNGKKLRESKGRFGCFLKLA